MMNLTTPQKIVAGYSLAMVVALFMALAGGSGPRMPNFEEALAPDKLINEINRDGVQGYVSLTDTPFEQALSSFAAFLGPDWDTITPKRADYRDLAGQLDVSSIESLQGAAMFESAAFPDTRVSFVQAGAPMSGSAYMNTVLVTRKPGDGSAAE